MTIEVLFNDFKRDPEELVQEELLAVEDVIRSGWWVLGKHVQTFETAWAECCESHGAVGVANGLDAIEIGLRAIGVGPGDEVITPSLTAYATILAIQRCGATPVFADIDPSTACLSPSSALKCINQRTKALIVVHLYGRSADLEHFQQICNQHNIHLVEDCAQAHLARFRGAPVGSFGSFAAWSFYPTKNLGAIGDAGAITSNDQQLLDVAKRLRNYGQTDRYRHDLAGMNSRLDDIQAALLAQRLKYLHQWTKKRRSIAKRYFNEITNPNLSMMQRPPEDDDHVHHLFVIKTRFRDEAKEYLAAQGIHTLIHYPIPCHLQRALGPHGIVSGGLVETERHANLCLSLPIHPYLSESEVNHVIQCCNSLHD